MNIDAILSYKGRQVPLGVIARELGRDAVVEGSISRSGDRLRVSVQLLRADESRVWGQDYERPAADLFVIQGEIAGMIAEAIHLSMTPAERRTLTSAPIVQVQAQDAVVPPLPSGIGDAIMKAFGLPPSRRVGEIKRALEQAVEAGEVASHQESEVYIAFLRENASRFGI